MNADKQRLLQLLYLIARNYHFYPESGVLTYLENKGIKNKKHLKELSEDQLCELSHAILIIFLTYMSDNKTPKMELHYNQYYKPLLDFLRITYSDRTWV